MARQKVTDDPLPTLEFRPAMRTAIGRLRLCLVRETDCGLGQLFPFRI